MRHRQHHDQDYHHLGFRCVCLLLLFSCIDCAYQERRPIIRDSPYFIVHQTLPRLQQRDDVLNVLPSNGGPVPVTYTNCPKGIATWLKKNIPVGGCTIGIDVESVPDTPWMRKKVAVQGPATVQIATPTSVLVVHLLRSDGRPSVRCIPLLQTVLADKSIVKAGTGIDQDMIELYRDWGDFPCRSRLDLGGIGMKAPSRCMVGLKKLTKAIVGVDLVKNKKITMSDWSKVPLTAEQLNYCARDAWAGAAVMDVLAQLDPDTFSTASVIETLSTTELSMDVINQRALERRRAKQRLNLLRDVDGLTGPEVQEVHHLRLIMKELAPVGLVPFDILCLGFTMDEYTD